MMDWNQYKKTADAQQRADAAFDRLFAERCRKGLEPGPGGWWYHHAPTVDRARIQQHGLQPSVPNRNQHIWGDLDQQPEGVYFMNSPTAAEPMMRQRPPEHQQPMDVWRVPSEGLEVHPDPIVWEKSVYHPNPVPDPELFRPYEKSNEFQQAYPQSIQEEQHSGPVPEDWVNYHDYHELGIPSDEEWASYGIGRDPQTWRQSGTSPKPWEAKMWHGKPDSKGVMGSVRVPFWTTSIDAEAHGIAGEGGSIHPVSVRFKNPVHYFGHATWGPESLEDARQRGADGAVVHWPADEQTPPRTWAIALDPGTIVPGHLKDSVTD